MASISQVTFVTIGEYTFFSTHLQKHRSFTLAQRLDRPWSVNSERRAEGTEVRKELSEKDAKEEEKDEGETWRENDDMRREYLPALAVNFT